MSSHTTTTPQPAETDTKTLINETEKSVTSDVTTLKDRQIGPGIGGADPIIKNN